MALLTDLAAVMLTAEASRDATVTSPAYRRILVAFAEAEKTARRGIRRAVIAGRIPT